MSDNEAIIQRAFDIKKQYLAGEITYKQAKVELADYIALYERLSAEKALKYGFKPTRFRLADFLKSNL